MQGTSLAGWFYGNGEQIILTEYIRHQIHHPEKDRNELFTAAELAESIETMRQYLRA